MKKEKVPQFLEKLNASMGVIETILRENLGIVGKLFVSQSENRWHDVNVKIEEDLATTCQLTATPLLRQMFKKAGLCIRCWYNEENDTCDFCVHVYYEHKYNGGSNGVELMRFSICFGTGEVEVEKDRK